MTTTIDSTRLANILFNSKQKVTEGTYVSICEDIRTDRFTLSEHVAKYKAKDSILGKNAYLLEDGTTVLVGVEIIESMNALNIDKVRLQSYMMKSRQNFKTVLETVYKWQQEK